MDWLMNLLWHDGQLFGVDWSIWKIVGWLGNLVFFSRFFVQWYATEKKKQVVVPVAFWWLSLTGSLLLLMFAYLFTWIPYIRNLVIHRRHRNAHTNCAACGKSCPPQSNFCPNCGARLGAANS